MTNNAWRRRPSHSWKSSSFQRLSKSCQSQKKKRETHCNNFFPSFIFCWPHLILHTFFFCCSRFRLSSCRCSRIVATLLGLLAQISDGDVMVRPCQAVAWGAGKTGPGPCCLWCKPQQHWLSLLNGRSHMAGKTTHKERRRSRTQRRNFCSTAFCCSFQSKIIERPTKTAEGGQFWRFFFDDYFW